MAQRTIYPWGDTRRFNSYAGYFRRLFGGRVQKLSVDAGFTCPNRDGTVGRGGCTFCASGGSGFETIDRSVPIREQLRINREYMGRAYKARKFIAFMQNYTNTLLKIHRILGFIIEHILSFFRAAS